VKRVCVLVLAIAGLPGCNREKAAEANNTPPPIAPATKNGQVSLPPDSPKLKQIKVEPVRTQEVPVDEVIAPGKIEVNPNRVSHVVLPLGGKVTNVLVHVGDFVKQGQALLMVESPDADAALSTYLQAEAAVTTAKSSLLKAKADVDRLHDLDEHQAVAKKDVLNAEAVYAQSQAALEQALATSKQAARRLELLGLKPGVFGQSVAVRAPISGKVLEMSVVPGEFRNDTNANLITIADLSSVWVTSDVAENMIRFIQKGERLEVELSAYPGQVFHARVTRIADTVDPTTRTLKVSAELANPGERLRPEMFGRIRHVDSTRIAPVIPAAAVIQGDNQNVVYREVSRGVFEPTPVKLGNRVGDLIAVLDGLRPGDRVVTDGAMLLKST
jgi:cobalt-zinc-cadmium efflux system membrane fusion protein